MEAAVAGSGGGQLASGVLGCADESLSAQIPALEFQTGAGAGTDTDT